jgi:hypothetical protein
MARSTVATLESPTREKTKSNFDIFLEKGQTAIYGFFICWLVVSILMIIMGGVFWADGEWELSVNCDLKKKINETLGIYTPAEIETFYQACIANANAELRWAQPVASLGASLFFVWFISLAYVGLNPPIEREYSKQERVTQNNSQK